MRFYSKVVRCADEHCGLDYQSHHLSTVSFLSPASLTEALKDDYKKMQERFIYGESLSYEELIERLTVLQKRFKDITCNTLFFRT